MVKDELNYVRILEYNLIQQVSFIRHGVRQNLIL